MKKSFVLFLVLLMVVSSLFASGSNEGTKSADSSALSGEINIYAAGNEQAAILLKETFEKKNPNVTVNYIAMSGGEIQTRVEAEAENPQADIILGGGCEGYIVMKNEGLLMQYKSPSAANYDPANYDPDGYWTAFTNSYLGFYSDKEWFDEQGIPVPTSWYDLLDPRLKGQVILTDPGKSSTGYMVVSTVCQLMGEEEGLKYLEELNKNVKTYSSSGNGPCQSVALGEAVVGVGYMQHGQRLINQGYTNMVITSPKEGTGLEISPIAIVNNCKNPEVAKAIVDWVTSSEFGQLFADTIGSSITASGACTPDMAEYGKNTKLLKLDYLWAAQNKKRLVEAWDMIVHK